MGGDGGGGCQDPALGEIPTRSELFDALQYDFFGGDAVEEVELGGLDDEEDSLTPDGFDEEEFQLDKEEGDFMGPLSEIDDLSSIFSKLNKISTGPANGGVSRGWGSRESLSSDLAEDPLRNWFDPLAYDAETIHESQKWPSHAYPSPSAHFMEPNSLHKTYPHHEQHPQNLHRQYSSEEVIIPNSSFTSYPSHGGRFHQASPIGPSNIPNRSRIFEPNLPSFPNFQLSQFDRNLPQLPHHLPVNSQIQNQLPNQNILYPWNDPPGFPNKLPPLQNSLGSIPPEMMPPQTTRMPYNPHLSSPPSDLEMLRSSKHHLIQRYPQHGSRFRSKYMTSHEIESIHRAHLAATHSNDPYSDDYYHQAIMARKSAGAKLRHHFCPTNLSDGSSTPSATNEPHPFLQVDGLGRVNFSSIHRPRPLLEVEKSNGGGKSKLLLEQEPMLAARVVIEDGMRLLLEVDDIDRFLQFNQVPDGGAQLRERRQILLEGLASSLLHLVDPLGKNGHLAPRDDLVFLAVISLLKGKKLLSRYLKVLSPGELSRVVCMAICRNLRFIFCNMPSDYEVSTVIQNLAKNVLYCVSVMDLKSLAACLSSVCGSELPSLRPIGHSDGDGASLILQAMLERAEDILRDPRAVYHCSVQERAFWQASFDVFFTLLMKYCFSKYDSVLQSLPSQGMPDVAEAINREMPIELMKVSLPHTSEQQKKLVLELVQRPVSAHSVAAVDVG